jgi:hypothetical protein
VTKRRTLIAASAVIVAAALLFTGWLTGVLALGDPFTGTWKATGADSSIVIRHTDEGDSFTFVYGDTSNGWGSAERHRNTLTFTGQGLSPDGRPTGEVVHLRFVFEPWTGNLLYDDGADGGGRAFPLKKVSNSTSAPPMQVQETPSAPF